MVEIGKIDDPRVSPGLYRPAHRDLQAGDRVHKGDLLAVLYSVDLGNKKNDLFDALSQLRLDTEVLKKAEAFKSAVPEVYLLNARRNVQADLNAVSRAENTLKTWEIPEDEIQAVRDEVKHFVTEQDRRTKASQRLKQWARVELRTAEDGYLIEQNVALHETVVDNTTNLFQISKVDPLIVLAAVPEDDLPALQDLKSRTHDQMDWTVSTVGSKPIAGFVDDISYLIDPNQHTAVVRGHIPNPGGLLRAGQFIMATVELPPPGDVVEVPIGAGGGWEGLGRLCAERGERSRFYDAPREGSQPLRADGLCPQRARGKGRRPGAPAQRVGGARDASWPAHRTAVGRRPRAHHRRLAAQDRAGEQACRGREERAPKSL